MNIAVVSGMPTVLNNEKDIDLIVSGEAIISYKYKYNNGLYSDDTLVSIPIKFRNLDDGSYTVSVIGRDNAGTWQTDEIGEIQTGSVIVISGEFPSIV